MLSSRRYSPAASSYIQRCENIRYLTKKFTSGFSILRSIRSFVLKDSHILLNKTLMQSDLNYRCAAWANIGNNCVVSTLQTFQNWEAVIILDANNREKSETVVSQLEWKIFERKVERKLGNIEVHDSVTPELNQNMPYELCGSFYKLDIPYSESKFLKRKLCNGLQDELLYIMNNLCCLSKICQRRPFYFVRF